MLKKKKEVVRGSVRIHPSTTGTPVHLKAVTSEGGFRPPEQRQVSMRRRRSEAALRGMLRAVSCGSSPGRCHHADAYSLQVG